MKKSFLFIFTLMITFAWCTIYAQVSNASTGKVPSLKLDRTHTVYVPARCNLAIIAYGYAGIAATTISIPIPAGTPFTTLGSWTPPVFASSMVKTPANEYYITEVGPPAALYQFNPGTGAVTLVGNITGMGADQPNGISYNPANGIYYIVSSANFYSFDLTTRVATLIGPFNTGGLMIDLCFDIAGTCYAYDLGVDNAYTINLTTGNATLLGALGYDANYGQGMSYDYETNTIYLSAFNGTTSTGQLRTMDATTGSTTLIVDWGFEQIAPFALDSSPNPCTVNQATNPTPANGATSVPVTTSQVSWTNGTPNAPTTITVYFNGVSIYSGTPITSHSIPALAYGTTYSWRVDGSNGSCTTYGATWSFTTQTDPNLVTGTVDIYPMNVDYWTGTCNASAKTQVSLVNALELESGWMVFDLTAVNHGPTTIVTDIVFNGYLYANNWPYWSITPMGTVNPISDPAATIYNQISAGYTQGTAYSFNQEAGTITNGWIQRPFEAPASVDMTSVLGQGWFAIGVVDWDFSTSYYVEFQGWNEANKPYLTVTYTYVTPVEFTAFTASANYGEVNLQWITATETNNQGFEVQRSNGSDFETIAFVAGHGTTTETQVYNYSDKSVGVATYSYRLKQIDFDGTFDYSKVINATVPAPAQFALDQNYPNPFNPSTKINFQLKVDSKVSLKVFNILGQEVATLINTNLVAGAHNVNFDASKLNSGVYLYRIEATGIDGSNFMDVKKMILTK